ncbi:MAG TPA: Slp/YeaY family lipoprotein [Verrucomicrobiae bacterium]|jgi:outer membrane lipoprotein|nr:Slp/YeaY family lipoprotein [Verrucomicrobiae bacterium]
MGKYIAVFLLAVLSGCASHPIAADLRRQAQPLTYTQVTANPKTTGGTIVIWGGRILDTVNNTNGGEIYVLQLPLNRRGRPFNNDSAAQGRFICFSPNFLDPAKYPRGRLITVAGRLAGMRNERLQNIFYRYPLLSIEQIHLWTNRVKKNNPAPNSGTYWGYYPLWWDGGVGWYYPEGYGTQQSRSSRSGGPPPPR